MKFSLESLRADFNAKKSLYGIEFEAKKEQLQIVSSVLQNRNVLGLLPTGFGKTLCMLMPAMLSSKKSITLIISPLTALIDDQLQKIQSFGLKGAKIEPLNEMNCDRISMIRNGECDVVLTSPESAVNPFWKDVFHSSKAWQKQIVLLAIDEAHCVSDWGEDFRPEYRMLHELRSILDCPLMALTATTTTKVKNDIINHLHLSENETDIVALKPDRPNIYLEIKAREKVGFFNSLDWLVTHIRNRQSISKKFIVYCRNINMVSELFTQTKSSLGEAAYADGVKDSAHILIEMYHNGTHQDSKRRIIDNFKGKNSKIRCVFATIALGMGIDIPDVDVIVHVGTPKSVLSYWQECGRCARDGRCGYALCLFDMFTLSLRNTEPEMAEIVKKSSEMCIRTMVLNKFEGSCCNKSPPRGCTDCKGQCTCSRCLCCSYCAKQCLCPYKREHDIVRFLEV